MRGSLIAATVSGLVGAAFLALTDALSPQSKPAVLAAGRYRARSA